VLPQFLQTNSSFFHAKIQALDFTDPASVTTINNWVSAQTNGKIPSILNNIKPLDVMYLINAIYFKSVWKEHFDPAQTKPGTFYLADNSTVQASFMHGLLDFNFYTDDKATVFELPYSNSKYSMVIVMPVGTTSLNALTAGLDPAQWQTWMKSLLPSKNTISMPKFKFSYSSMLNTPLKDLGLGVAFSDSADFSLINPDTTKKLQISEVLHKAFVETDENGTTAAAATKVTISYDTASAGPPSIDRPFIFAIREMKSGLILFAGTVNNPLLTGN
jgi:serpin B